MDIQTATSAAEIEILLHYHWSIVDHPSAFQNEYKKSYETFVSAGLLKVSEIPDKRYVENHDALCAYINALFAVPFPVQKWVIPTTENEKP